MNELLGLAAWATAPKNPWIVRDHAVDAVGEDTLEVVWLIDRPGEHGNLETVCDRDCASADERLIEHQR